MVLLALSYVLASAVLVAGLLSQAAWASPSDSLRAAFCSAQAPCGADTPHSVTPEAGEPVDTRDWRLGPDYWASYLSDTGAVLSLAGDVRNWRWQDAGLALTGTSLLWWHDPVMHRRVQRERSAATDRLADWFEPWGDLGMVTGAMTGLYLYGEFADDRRARQAAMLGLESAAIAGLCSQAVKWGVRRRRPCSGPAGEGTPLSFPSGHAATAFALAGVVATVYDDHGITPILAYGAASLAALSRVNDNAHWPSDVFAGSLLGYFVARTVTQRHGLVAEGLELGVVGDSDTVGLAVSRRF